MPITVGSEHRARADPRRPGAHSLLVADTDRERQVGAAAWVDRQLATGAKVYYKGWLEQGPRSGGHWLAGPYGALRAAEAMTSGQLEFLDFGTVVERCGGTTEGLRNLLSGEVIRAMHQGWSRVAMSQESPRRPMADENEAAEYAAQEAGFDEFAERWPVTTLCQLTIADENRAAAWESAAVHHHGILDTQWSSHFVDGRWWLRGELDAHVVQRFGAALYGALRERRLLGGGGDLEVDMSGVDFVDLACAQSLALTARSAGRGQRLLVSGASSFVRRVVETAGCPPTVLFV